MSTASSTRIPLLILVGPTASGKTDLLLELFASGQFPALRKDREAEVVSADSMQAYRGMDIGTAKPGQELRAFLPHRLIDILEPTEQYTAGDFVGFADAAIDEIVQSGRTPIISGGTGFYVRNFVFGLPEAPRADPAIRAAVQAEFESRGAAPLRDELAAGDPDSARRIHANDTYRLTRAVEILRATGRPMGDFAAPTSPRERYDFLLVELTRPRAELCSRIDARVDAMFEAGLPAEVEALKARGIGPEAPGMKAIGYREFFESTDAHSEQVTRERIKQNTRHYAKRQETFFASLPGLVRIEAGEGAAERLASLAEPFFGRRTKPSPRL